jgi:hypothetical protein
MPVIPVNRVVDKKRIIGEKMEGQGGAGEAQGDADQKMARTAHLRVALKLESGFAAPERNFVAG